MAAPKPLNPAPDPRHGVCRERAFDPHGCIVVLGHNCYTRSQNKRCNPRRARAHSLEVILRLTVISRNAGIIATLRLAPKHQEVGGGASEALGSPLNWGFPVASRGARWRSKSGCGSPSGRRSRVSEGKYPENRTARQGRLFGPVTGVGVRAAEKPTLGGKV